MYLTVNNQSDLSNKYIRLIKWRLYGLKRKFDQLLYAEVSIRTEGQKPKTYVVNLRLGIPGNDIIIRNKSTNLKDLMHRFHQDAHRYLADKRNVRVANVM